MPAVAVFIGGAIVMALAIAVWWSIGVIRLDRQATIDRQRHELVDLLNRSRPYDWVDERDDRRYP